MANISSQLSKLNVGKARMRNGLTIEQNLINESHKLMECIQARIDEYYDSYDPTIYKRTWRFEGALYAEDFIDIDVSKNKIFVNLKFNSDLAYHDNFSGGQSYVPLLINDGWAWDGYEMPAENKGDHFHNYGGFHFLEKGIEDWNKTNSMGIKVELNKIWKGTQYSNSIYR